MKSILITGMNSYVGNSFQRYVSQGPFKYNIDFISLKSESWKEKSFSKYDIIFHVAGIAHVSADPKLEEMYNEINRDLTINVATKAKNEGVKQFIFMSSIIVYGDSRNYKKPIDKNTMPKPSDFYGHSKLEAEKGIILLQSEGFKVVIIRSPMIYGKGSKGNYQKLSKAAQILPIFPDVENQRSMIYIDNLCQLLVYIIDNNESGLFYPQNREYIKTSDMVKLIANVHGKKIKLVKIFNPILNVLKMKYGLLNKIFGSLVYEHDISEYRENYRIRNFKESIYLTEEKNGN